MIPQNIEVITGTLSTVFVSSSNRADSSEVVDLINYCKSEPDFFPETETIKPYITQWSNGSALKKLLSKKLNGVNVDTEPDKEKIKVSYADIDKRFEIKSANKTENEIKLLFTALGEPNYTVKKHKDGKCHPIFQITHKI